MSKPPKGNQSCLHEEERLVSEQTSKRSRRSSCLGGTPLGQGRRRIALGWPASLGRHLWSPDQAMKNNMGLEEGKVKS